MSGIFLTRAPRLDHVPIPDRLSAALTGRYRIERELGAGGMATVYLAHDEKHGRKVAIKVLEPGTAAAADTDRFQREIEIAARLQHPHIVSLIDSGQVDRDRFYIMPYIDGETLRSRLLRDSRLPLDAALSIAREVADALAHAHRHGVVHRDIKPENILLANGHAHVADFGIARASSAPVEMVTETGMAVGTPTYVAPEQAVGEKELDGRADLYSLGCVLFEMLTGDPPYMGATPQASLIKRFVEPIPSIRARQADAPAWLDLLLQSTLATDPRGRPASASEFLAALETGRHSTTPRSVAPIDTEFPSIAVLPFANMSADPENEYFSDGITEDLITALTEFPNLKVIARSSAFSFKGKNLDVREIGRSLGVRHVLEGSVRRVGSALRVTAQLVNTTDGSHEWSRKFDRTLSEVFAIQDELTEAIRDGVGGTLIRARAETSRTTDQDTYDLVLRGRALLMASSVRGDEAMDLLRRATERDPTYVPALVALADAHAFSTMWARVRGTEAWAEVRRLTDDIVRLAPGSPSAERLLAALQVWTEHDFPGAIARLQRVVALNPSDGIARGLLATMLVGGGRSAESDAHNRRLISLDPVGTFGYTFAANNWACAGDFAAAEVAASEVISIDPRYPEGYHMRGYNRNYLGRFEDAYDDLVRVPALGNRTAWPMAKRCAALAGLGRYDEVQRVLDEMLERGKTEFMSLDAIACVYQLLGRNDQAFECLDRAVVAKAVWLPFIGIEALFVPLRRDPRFANFCSRHRIPMHPLPPTALERLPAPTS